MKNAFVLMTAMPPTLGHKALIDFASCLEVEYVNVLVNVQPDEPFGYARYHALCRAFINNDQIQIRYYDKFIQQNPKDDSDDAFWQMWVDLIVKYGYTEGDYLVASENYGIRLAQEANAVFMPYDPDRSIVPTKATSIRENTLDNFDQILPEFRHILRKRITVFGAESTGKTTLSRALAEKLNSQWLPEYARPYLEMVGNELDDEVMGRIAKGQMAYQLMGYNSLDPFLIQDTDLFSTIGYWEFWSGHQILCLMISTMMPLLPSRISTSSRGQTFHSSQILFVMEGIIAKRMMNTGLSLLIDAVSITL